MTATRGGPALVTPGRTVVGLALAQLAETARAGLARAVSPGSTLGVWVADPVDFTAGVRAALAAGSQAFVIPADAGPDRVTELCAIEAAPLVLCDAERAGRLGGGTPRACAPGLVLVETGLGPRAGGDDEPAVHFFTSGTEGRPKGIVRTRSSLELEESILGSHLGMGAGCAVLCAIPVAHGYGFTAGLFAPLSFGGTSIVAQPRLAASLAKLLITYEPEVVVAVPAQYAAWSRPASRETFAGPVPRVWLCGGAPLPAAVRAKFEAVWGGVIAEQYGMTECGAVSVDLDGAATLGRPYPGVRVTVDGGGPDGTAGELVVRTPYGPSGYLGERADARFTPEGFRTGDSGWVDGQGRLHLAGRRAHQLNVRGKKLDPAEVERAFWTLDGVQDVAVIGVDRASGDQWIAAFVACAEAVTDDELARATVHLDGYKRPQRVTRLATLPKTPAGKTDFPALRAMSERLVT